MAVTTIDATDDIVGTIRNASAGDTIRINDGTHTSRVLLENIQFPNNNPVVVEAVNPGNVTIDGNYAQPGGAFVTTTTADGVVQSSTGTYATLLHGNQTALGYVWGGLIHFKNCRNIHFKGINSWRSRGRGLTIQNCRGIKFLDGYVKNSRASGVWIGGCQDTEIGGAEVHDSSNFFPYARSPSVMNWGVTFNTTNGSQDTYVHDCWVWGTWAEGIGSGHNIYNLLWQDCFIGPHLALGVYMHFGYAVQLDRCVIYHDASDTYNRGSTPSSCVVWNKENDHFPNEGQSGDQIMSNCIVLPRSDGEGIDMWNNQGSGKTSGRNIMRNNLVLSRNGPCLSSIGNVAGTHSDTQIYNNAFMRQQSGNPYLSTGADISGSTIKFGYNAWSEQPPAGLQGTGDVTGQATFVNAITAEDITAGTKPDPLNYRITSGSNTNNAGSDTVPYSLIDFYGTNRSSPIDIGHHQLDSGVTGDPPTWDDVPQNQTLTVGTAFSLTIAATDPESATVTYAETGLPGGLTLNTSTGAITGTPTAQGTYAVTLSATDGTFTINQPVTYTVGASAVSLLASFTVAKDATTDGKVTCTDTSTATGTTITSWRWDMGDGTIYTSQNVTHTYSDSSLDYRVTLRIADSSGGTNRVTNGDFESGQTGWKDYDPTNNASLVAGAVSTATGFSINSSGQNNCQLYQDGISVTSGTFYTCKFHLKGNGHCQLRLIQDDSPFANLGLSENIPMTDDYTPLSYTFECTATESNARLQFASFSGNDEVVITIDEVELIEANSTGVEDNTSQEVSFVEPIVPGLSLDVSSGTAPLTVTVTDSTTMNGEEVDITSHKFQPGDGSEYDLTIGGTASHTYTQAGDYNATVRVETS